jgi:hypothetical protein
LNNQYPLMDIDVGENTLGRTGTTSVACQRPQYICDTSSGLLHSHKMPSSSPDSLKFTVVWMDEDLQEVVISASSKLFAGATNLYLSPNGLIELADAIQGFPLSTSDRREFRLGHENLSGYGTAQFSLYCVDSLGHAVIEVELRQNSVHPYIGDEHARVNVTALPADIDRLELALRQVNGKEGQSATLASAA